MDKINLTYQGCSNHCPLQVTVEEGKELQSELKRKGESEAKELFDQLDVKTKSVQYATKADVSRLEDKLDALLKQSVSDDKE